MNSHNSSLRVNSKQEISNRSMTSNVYPRSPLRRRSKSRNPLQMNLNSNPSFTRSPRSTSPSPLNLMSNLQRSHLSRNQSEFDSMLSNIRPSRSNSVRSFKPKAEYNPQKTPRKPSLKQRPNIRAMGIDLAWERNSGDSLRGNSFSIQGKALVHKNRFKVRMETISGKKERENRRVSFIEKPKVIHVENWKILNVDMSKEGKLYNKFNRGSRGKGDDKCTVF